MQENKSDVLALLEEAISLELNVSRLYKKFFDCDEDSEFWWRLMLEEKNHAALLKTGKDYFLKMLPSEILPESLNELVEANKTIKELIDSKDTPSRAEKFKIALKLEESAGEIHFQNAMQKETSEKVLSLFQKLNEDDKDHAERIRQYMDENGIK